MSESLYLVLPANASPDDFPENKNSKYKVRLPERLRLDASQWEIALVDMFYSNNWHNIDNGYMTVKKYERDERPNGEARRVGTYKVDVRSGRYHSLEDVVEEVHNALTSFKLEKSLQVFYDKVRDLMFLMFFDGDHEVKFSSDLGGVLGFTKKGFYSRTSEMLSHHTSEISPDLNQGFTSLYVYCSLCQKRMVGHTMVELLRVLPIRSSKKANVYEEVQIPHYIEVSNTDTDVVEVNICRDDGEFVPFNGGKVSVTVHLRVKQR